MKNRNIALYLSLLSAGCVSAQSQVSRPNIIFIVMDDLGYGDLGCYGQEKIETPHIDSLARQGMLFTRCYSGAPVSGPSRCVLPTGLHTGHSQIRVNDEMAERGPVNNYDSMYEHRELEGQRPLREGTMTIATLARKAGYATGIFGKWGLGFPGSSGEPLRQGFDHFYGYICQRLGHNHYPAFLYADNQRVYTNNPLVNTHTVRLGDGQDPLDGQSYASMRLTDYADDIIYRQMTGFIDENRHKPFLVMWTTTIPHVSLQAPKEWVDYYVHKFGDEKPYLGNAGYGICRYPHATYAAMVSYFDALVGQLVGKLKAMNLFDNTLIVITSDNGPTFNGGSDSPWFKSAGPFRSEYGWAKNFLHEGGIRVPAIVVWKNSVRPHTVSNHICAFQDFMPTVADLVKTDCPPTDGISILPTLVGACDKQQVHPYLYWEYPDPKHGSKALRLGDWKGIVSNLHSGNDKLELYDLKTDSLEQHDVASKYPKIVKQMKALMAEAHVDN